ncbi:PAS domain S-box protein [Paraburkholderia sp. SOS3]|uniref:PAS domain S-box protein n=1 Tax=Paraburkholderia sp. SOS3 TaxID=1926494 RepID=UPI000B2A815F|nr:PAS domain S-box protein [Paraburkholderia sp. SOS3]
MATDNQGNSPMKVRRWVRRERPLAKPAIVCALVVVIGLMATFAVARAVMHELRQSAQARFERRIERITTTVRNELQTSALWLATAREVVEASPRAPRQVSREFADTLDPGRAATPVRAFEYVPADTIADAQAPRDPASSAPADGPPEGNSYADPAVHAALRDAAQSGQVVLTAPAAPYASADQGERGNALFLVLPVRTQHAGDPAAASAATVSGFLLASIDPGRLFEPAGISERGLDMSLAIGSPPQTVYSAARGDEDAPGARGAFAATRPVSFGGAMLTLAFSADAGMADAGAAGPVAIVLVAGLAATVLAALACYWISLHASSPARVGDAVLNEARMMNVVQASSDAIITIDDTQRIVIFNPMAERVFGVSAMEAIGTTLDRFIPARYRAAHAGHVEQFGVTGVSTRQMGRQRVLSGIRANGEEFPLEASISQVRDRMGKLYTVVLRDVTERVYAENALKQSREELRDLSANLQQVREEEKMRIARELHDDLGQQLSALKMDLSSAEQALAPAQTGQPAGAQAAAGEALQLLAGMRKLIDSTVASLRRIAADLRPVMLDDLGLLPAIDWLARDFNQRYGIPVEQHIHAEQTNFTREAATAIFRIVQEALNNVARHADATNVRLRLATDEGLCTLQVIDDGRGAGEPPRWPGTQQQAELSRTFGLIGVRERARMLDGTVTIETAKDKGFILTVSFPLRAVQQEETLL